MSEALPDLFPGFESRTTSVGEVEIFARTGGSGPPLLLLHGYPQTHACWHKVAPSLAERFTVVAMDLRGYGQSAVPEPADDHSTYSKRAMARDAVGLMAALGFPRFHLAGHDRGGRVAYRLALDHPAVRESINALAARGVTVVTLVSDVPGSKRAHYAGIDNSSAGRTAGSLMGRFLRGATGKVGLIAGSLALRDHIERQFGFEQVMTHEYPHLALLPVRESRDDWRKLEEMTAQLLAEHRDLIGIYNVGGGTRGIVSCLEEKGRAKDIVLIAHDLSDTNRKALIRGTIDAVINQEPGHEVRSAVRVLMSKADNVPLIESQERIRIDIFLRDNLP